MRSGACLGLTGARCRQEEERRPGSLPPKSPLSQDASWLPRERYPGSGTLSGVLGPWEEHGSTQQPTGSLGNQHEGVRGWGPTW